MIADNPSIVAIQATLTKLGYPGVDYEVARMDDGCSYQETANGKARVFYPKFSQQELMSGTARPWTLREAWEIGTARHFAGYAITNLIEVSLA